ncbi:Ig-like domain-containing protein, partial [Deinococcus sp.]|uniref:Ig-like domain-containing protein n=1 Tax=Deinococcus sp. TaxID=47478 RepID=UPI002869C4A1
MRRLSSFPARQITASAFLLTALMTACNPGNGSNTVTGVTVTPATATLRPADSASFTATVAGTGSFSQSVTWKSSDASVVMVDGNGTAKALKAGTATISATSTTDTGKSGTANVTVDPNAFSSEPIKVNFQPAPSAAPGPEYVVDSGAAYADATGYGWVTQDTHTGLDISANTRDRAIAGVDARLNTMIHMQYVSGSSSQGGVATPAAWEYKVPNGSYTVTVAVGDASNSVDSKHVINIEGLPTVTAFTPTSTQHFTSVTRRVTVSDGRITVDAKGGTNTKLDYVIIAPGDRPSVATPTPQEGQTMVNPATGFSAELNVIASTGTKGSGLDAATLTSSTVLLKEDATGAAVPSSPNTSGGGDVIVVKAASTLKANTKYRLKITSGVKDVNGLALLPYETTFTTGPVVPPTSGLAFTQVDLSTVPTTYAYTSVEVGPDGKLYASTLTGEIVRFAINADGTLGTPEVLKGLVNAQGKKTVIGLKFDPTSTADNLKLWISNNDYYVIGSKNTPDYSGRITLLSGPNLDTVQDYITGLPRSVKDHMTNSVNFNPKEPGILYFMQGSNSAMGAADATWGNRTERLLSGTMLRVDLSKMTNLPLSVITPEGGGSYNPYAAGAPLTIYATGIRNAYDMVFHKNGSIYAPTNGSAAGGNTPASTAGAPCA